MSDLQGPPPEDAPVYDSGVRYTFINPDTGVKTENLTAPEVFELEEQWRAEYDARIQAEMEASAAAYVPEPYEEDE